MPATSATSHGPGQATRTLIAAIVEIGRERLAAGRQRRRGVEPRVERGWVYALLRTFTTVVTRDVSVQGVVNDMCEGRAAIYVDMLGYDEVAHHSGPERVDALAVLRDLDRHVGRIERTATWTPRPYKIVVLSDHGQTQGATFDQRTGQTLAELVAELCGAAASGDGDAEAGNTESSAWLRHARHQEGSTDAVPSDVPVVLGSGSLGLISIPGEPRRLTREEIDARYPRLISGLAAHPEIGFVLVRQSNGSSVVLGNGGSLDLATGDVVGEDPLAPFGPRAREQVAEVDGYSTVADLMVNSRYDPDLEEVAAFEDQVSSHGGLGGPQTHPFLLYPAELSAPVEPIFTSPAMHKVLKGWLTDSRPPRQPARDSRRLTAADCSPSPDTCASAIDVAGHLTLALEPRTRATDPLAVGLARAIEVDGVAPTVGDGGVETAELFFDRCSVLGPDGLEKLLEQCSESSHDLHRGRTELADLRESERHEVLPAASHHHDRGRRVGAGELRARVEIGPPDVAENLSDVVEDLDGGRGVVHGGRERPVRDVDHHPQRERRVLVEGALVAERDHSLELLGGSRAELASVDKHQHFTCLHEVADRVR